LNKNFFCISMSFTLMCCMKFPRVNKQIAHRIEFGAKEEAIISYIEKNTDLKIFCMGDFTRKWSLGAGNSSQVYLLVSKKKKRNFAGKIYRESVGTTQFINEVKIMKSCSKNCASIVNLVGIIIKPRCLVLDYHAYGSLDVVLKKDSSNMKRGMETEFPFLLRLSYVLDMCHGVTELHRNNICHRDIAMRNLLLSDDKKHVVLSDFSLSRILDTPFDTQSTYTTTVPRTSAPETFGKTGNHSYSEKWERHYSLKADIWSLGIAMFEIIRKEWIDPEKWYKLPSRFPAEHLPPTTVFNREHELWCIILRCWDKKPERRPPSWEVQEKIENLYADPLNVQSQSLSYINRFSKLTMARTSNITVPRVNTECTFINRFNTEATDTQFSCTFMEQGSENVGSPSDVTGFLCNNTKGFRRSIVPRKSSQLWKQHGLQLKTIDNSKVKNYLKPICPAMTETYEPSTNKVMNYLQPVPSWGSERNFGRNSDGSSTVGEEMKLTSTPSTSSVSFEEGWHKFDKLQYCRSLSFSLSAATNIRDCGDRQFFKLRAKELAAKEKFVNPIYSRISYTESSVTKEKYMNPGYSRLSFTESLVAKEKFVNPVYSLISHTEPSGINI